MKPRSLLLALAILALCWAINPKITERTMLRAAVWQSMKTILRPLGIH